MNKPLSILTGLAVIVGSLFVATPANAVQAGQFCKHSQLGKTRSADNGDKVKCQWVRSGSTRYARWIALPSSDSNPVSNATCTTENMISVTKICVRVGGINGKLTWQEYGYMYNLPVKNLKDACSKEEYGNMAKTSDNVALMCSAEIVDTKLCTSIIGCGGDGSLKWRYLTEINYITKDAYKKMLMSNSCCYGYSPNDSYKYWSFVDGTLGWRGWLRPGHYV